MLRTYRVDSSKLRHRHRMHEHGHRPALGVAHACLRLQTMQNCIKLNFKLDLPICLACTLQGTVTSSVPDACASAEVLYSCDASILDVASDMSCRAPCSSASAACGCRLSARRSTQCKLQRRGVVPLPLCLSTSQSHSR